MKRTQKKRYTIAQRFVAKLHTIPRGIRVGIVWIILILLVYFSGKNIWH